MTAEEVCTVMSSKSVKAAPFAPLSARLPPSCLRRQHRADVNEFYGAPRVPECPDKPVVQAQACPSGVP